MTKEDVIIHGLQEEMKKANGIIQKQDKELEEAKEEIEELELANKTLTETIEFLNERLEVLQNKLKDKDVLIGQIKDEIKINRKEILLHLLEGRDLVGTVKFILGRMGL